MRLGNLEASRLGRFLLLYSHNHALTPASPGAAAEMQLPSPGWHSQNGFGLRARTGTEPRAPSPPRSRSRDRAGAAPAAGTERSELLLFALPLPGQPLLLLNFISPLNPRLFQPEFGSSLLSNRTLQPQAGKLAVKFGCLERRWEFEALQC